ncbi:MAG: LytR family transcriptional regulator [Clostridia bacterium]|nr:LytR family transcriptional regulator [Clostridia bacterium]
MTESESKAYGRGAGFYFGRFLTALLGLVVGAAIFFWNALGGMGYVNIGAVGTGSTAGLNDYLENESEGVDKLGEVAVRVDPDYPIRAVAQKDRMVENLLVFGIDSRGEEISRADSIIVVSVDRREKTIKLTSILRDTEMRMNGGDGNKAKVNASYAYGGVGMLINTLNDNLDLDIQKFVMFDFWSAAGFVDALNGVEIKIEEKELEATNGVIRSMAPQLGKDPAQELLTAPGVQALDGVQAISWARVRKIDSDFGRTSRQRELMEVIIKEFAERNVLDQSSFAVDVLAELETNIRRLDITNIGLKAAGSLSSVEQYYVPQEGMFTTNTSNWNMIYDADKQIPALHDFIWGEGRGSGE